MRATLCRHRVCTQLSECNRVEVIQAVCHINVELQVESGSVSFDFVYVCVLALACLHMSA